MISFPDVFNSFVEDDIDPGQKYEVKIRTAGQVEVVNRTLRGQVWCRFDGQEPEIRAHDNFVVMLTRRFNTNKGIVVVRFQATQKVDISIEGSIFGRA
jgi:hypothetical protein